MGSYLVYLLAAAMFLVPFGRIADIYGRKRTFAIGITIDAIASILCAISNSGTWLILFRALQGLGGAMIFGTGVAILTSVFPAKERGRAIGVNVAAVYVGLSVVEKYENSVHHLNSLLFSGYFCLHCQGQDTARGGLKRN